MAQKCRVKTVYNAAGEARFRISKTAPKPSDVKGPKPRSRGEKGRNAPPRAYLKLLRMDFTRYLKVTAETVPVDAGSGVVFIVSTGGGGKGGQHVDTWGAIETDQVRPGFTCLASVRTPWNIWVPETNDYERAAAIEILRPSGVKHPLRAI